MSTYYLAWIKNETQEKKLLFSSIDACISLLASDRDYFITKTTHAVSGRKDGKMRKIEMKVSYLLIIHEKEPSFPEKWNIEEIELSE